MCVVPLLLCSRRCTAVVALIGDTCRAVKHSCLMKANWQRNLEKPASVTLCMGARVGRPKVIQCCVVCVCVCVCMCVSVCVRVVG